MKPQNTFFKWIVVPIIFSLFLSSVLVSPPVSAQDEPPVTPTEIPTEEPVADDFPEPTPQPPSEDEAFQSFSVQTVTTPSPADPDCSDGRCVFIVSASSDDAGVHPNCTYSASANEIYMGQCTNGQFITSGFRFPNVNIPQGTVIQNAYLEFTLDGPYTDDLNVVFYGQDSVNALPFTNISRPSNRPIISAYPVNWHIPATEPWSLDQIGESPSLTPIIQEIVNRPAWAQGNAIAIILKNVGPSSGTFKHRRVIAYNRFTSTYGAANAARLVINLKYDCSDYESTLSPIGQAVYDVVNVDGDQNYCLNKFEKLTIIEDPSSASDAFKDFADLAEEANYEIDFTTMIWDDGDNSPGEIFLSGVKALYEIAKSDPKKAGIRIRILLGQEHYTIVDQRKTVLADLRKLGIPLDKPEIDWKIEVASYRNSKDVFSYEIPNIHSHVKLLIVDGEKAIVSGYNFQTRYLETPSIDAGLQISGPIVQDALKMFDELWANARGLKDCFGIPPYCEYPVTQIQHKPEVLAIRPINGDDSINIFSLFRNDTVKAADTAIIEAMNSATSHINLLQNRFFENYPISDYICVKNTCYPIDMPPSLPYGERGPMSYSITTIEALRNGVDVQLILSGEKGEDVINVLSMEQLRQQILLEPNSSDVYSHLKVKFTNQLMHAKAISIDGQFLIVGSQNFDYSSFGNDHIMDLTEFSFGLDDTVATGKFDTRFDTVWDTARDLLIVNDSIQDTVNQASSNAVILIPEGVYHESVTINKPLTIIGLPGRVVIETPALQPAFQITSSDVRIYGVLIRGGTGYGIELIDVSQHSLKNIILNNIIFENNTLGGVLVRGLIPGSPVNYNLENNTFIGGQSGVTINMLENQATTSLIRNNIFIGQSFAPIQILSGQDGNVEYSYNLFSICGLNKQCIANWHLGNLSANSNAYENLFDLDPKFMNPVRKDYRLAIASPMIDAGDPSFVGEMIFDGNGDGISQIDIGAFESFITSANLPPTTDDVPDIPGLVTDVSPNNTNLRYFINPTDDEDWFLFYSTQTGNLQVHLTSLPANYDLYIYDASGKLLGSSTKYQKAAELIKLSNAAPGYYYVRVVGVNGSWDASNSYQLRFNIPGTGGP